MENCREPGDAFNQNIGAVNELESSRVRTKLLKGSALQKKGKIIAHFSVWLTATFKLELLWRPCLPVSRHSQAPESPLLALRALPTILWAAVTISFLALWIYRGFVLFRIKRVMGLANSQEEVGRGGLLLQYHFQAVVKCGVETQESVTYWI